MLHHHIKVDANDSITELEIYSDDGSELLYSVARNKWSRKWIVTGFLGDESSWTLGTNLSGLLTELSERDSVDGLFEWLGESDQELAEMATDELFEKRVRALGEI